MHRFWPAMLSRARLWPWNHKIKTWCRSYYGISHLSRLTSSLPSHQLISRLQRKLETVSSGTHPFGVAQYAFVCLKTRCIRRGRWNGLNSDHANGGTGYTEGDVASVSMTHRAPSSYTGCPVELPGSNPRDCSETWNRDSSST